MNSTRNFLALLAVTLLAAAVHAETPAPPPVRDAKAEETLKQMGKTLAGAKTFSYVSNITVDMFLDDGQKVQTAKTQRVDVKRPGSISATVTGDNLNLRFVFDGKQVLIHNTDVPSYAIVDAPPTIDAMFDMLANDYGLVIPLADLLFDDPYKTLMENVKSSKYLGLGYVNQTQCHHLAFQQDSVDWQIWVDQGEVAIPRKVVITYKEQAGSPQFTAVFAEWNLAATPAADAFAIKPPAGVAKQDLIKVAPATQPANQPAAEPKKEQP